MWFVVINLGEGGGGWSQIKPITFENELKTYDMIPYTCSTPTLEQLSYLEPHFKQNIKLRFPSAA